MTTSAQIRSQLIQALLDQRRGDAAARSIDLVWSGPDAGAGAITRDQSVLIRQLVERAEQRLLITTYAFNNGPFIKALFQEKAVCHVKAVVADEEVLVTSANLTDAAQLSNVELGLHLSSPSHADDVWDHFDRLIQQGLLRGVG